MSFRRPPNYVIVQQARRRRRWILPLLCAIGAFIVGMGVDWGLAVSVLLAVGAALVVTLLRPR